MKLKILYAYNIVLTIFGALVLFVSSVFWLGTMEEHQRIIRENAPSHFFGRLLMSVIISVILSAALLLINAVYQKLFKLEFSGRKMWAISVLEISVFITCSIIFILIGMR